MLNWLKLKQTISAFEKEASNIVDKRKLAHLLIILIDKILKIQSGYVFLLDKKKENYQVITSLNYLEQDKKPISHTTSNLLDYYGTLPCFGFEEDLIEILTNKEEFLTVNDFKNFSPQTVEKLQILKARLCVPMIIKEHLIGFITVGEKINKKNYNQFEYGFIQKLAYLAAENLEKILLYREVAQNLQALESAYKQLQEYVHIIEAEKEALEQAYLDITHTLVVTLEARDTYTRGHSDRVVHYARAIAREMNLPPEEIKKIELAASLHDIGKIGTRDKILLKEASLTAEEQWEMRQHSQIGANILSSLGFLEPIVPLIRGHHEKWDGSGYPDGLKGKDIPMGARIISVADAFDAMTSNRPYRKDMGIKKALAIIESEAKIQFDHIVVQAFLKIHED